MDSENIRTITDVYPLPVGEAVTYENCAIDELDNEGNLRIVAVRADRDDSDENLVGLEYAVWVSGTFLRAETRREIQSGNSS